MRGGGRDLGRADFSFGFLVAGAGPLAIARQKQAISLQNQGFAGGRQVAQHRQHNPAQHQKGQPQPPSYF
ncbi:MAG: hypothetical protein HC918_14145 [Oscillatoriales cyanobacterium SM2_1_8]|nr:hypothetical protein [Oscillatoriales cyanobacterium SM2_1_8]